MTRTLAARAAPYCILQTGLAAALLLGLAHVPAQTLGGDEKDGFIKVETSGGTGWVKSILMRKQ